jgi:hypothetical protein
LITPQCLCCIVVYETLVIRTTSYQLDPALGVRFPYRWCRWPYVQGTAEYEGVAAHLALAQRPSPKQTRQAVSYGHAPSSVPAAATAAAAAAW